MSHPACPPTSMRPARVVAGFGALAMAALLVVSASAGAASGPASPQPPLRVTARADASVAAARPHLADHSARLLHVGGRARWRALLRFDLRPGTAVGKATLGVWALARPRGPILVHAVRSGRTWRERHLTFARAPDLGPVAGRAGPRPCPRNGRQARACHRAGQWVWIDVTPAVGGASRVAFGLTARTRRALRLASREDRHHAPRLLVQTAPPAALAPAPAPAAASPSAGAPA